MTEDKMVGWHHQLSGCDVSLNKLREMVKDRKAWCAAVHGVAKSQTHLNDNNNNACTWRAWSHLDPSLPLARTETTIACMQVGRRRTSSVPSNPSGPDPASGQGLHTREKSGTNSEVQPKPLGLPRHIPSQGRGCHHVQERPSSFRAPAPASWAQPCC